MKNYTIYNNPGERLSITYPFVWWDNGFSSEELDKIVAYCEDQGLERSHIIGEENEENVNKIRRCDVKFHFRNDDTAWIFDRLNGIITAINTQFYGFDLNGYSEFQYTSYNSEEEGTYDWHMDMHLGADLPGYMIEPRKLSMSLLLNEQGKDFEGGDFMFNLSNVNEPVIPQVPRGRIIFFPSFLLHKVSPVTKGYRKSLVVWATGPKFQ